MISLIDTHCHVDLDTFQADRPAVFERMRTAGVHAAILIAYNPERWETSAGLCRKHQFLRRAVGVHPNDANLWSNEIRERLIEELARGDAVAVGETGLDFYREHASADQQRSAFVAQIEIARSFGLPIVIHQRNAEREVLETLERFAPVSGVMHCFSGDTEFAAACIQLGLQLGIGGVLTYPRSDAIRRAVQTAPLDRIVLETDAPFLAPQSVRGKRNEPANVAEVANVLAEQLGVSLAELAEVTTENAIRLFGISLESARMAGMEHTECV